LIILEMVINMNETNLRTIEQIEAFLTGSASVTFTAAGTTCHQKHKGQRIGWYNYPVGA
jgi:hypothetical protein